MVRRILVAFAASSVVCLVEAQTSQPASAPASQPSASSTVGDGLPHAWLGKWAGPASLSISGRPARNFAMELHIAPTASRERFTWTIIYVEGEQRQERPYELVVKDAMNGIYEVDEKNSIRLPMLLLDGGFYSSFEVEGSLLNASYRLEAHGTPDERIILEIISFAAATENTGGAGGVPEVRTRKPMSLQRAVLRRGGGE